MASILWILPNLSSGSNSENSILTNCWDHRFRLIVRRYLILPCKLSSHEAANGLKMLNTDLLWIIQHLLVLGSSSYPCSSCFSSCFPSIQRMLSTVLIDSSFGEKCWTSMETWITESNFLTSRVSPKPAICPSHTSYQPLHFAVSCTNVVLLNSMDYTMREWCLHH